MPLCSGTGPKNSCKICIIGEAPGETEERLGLPFVGEAGRKLDELLNNAGIVRSLCYVTNVIKERPRHNDASQFITFKQKQVLTTPAYDEYEKLLWAELATCSANVFVPMGNIALYALTRFQKITKRRGSIYAANVPGLEGRKVIPCLHPAYLLYKGHKERDSDNEDEKGFRHFVLPYVMHQDLKRVKEDSEYPELNLPKREMIIRPSFKDVLDYFLLLKDASEFAFDIETTPDEVSCISFCERPELTISIPFISSGGDYFDPLQESAIWRRISELLANKQKIKDIQNSPFDAVFLFRKFGIRTQNIDDTMLMQRILYPDLPASLEYMTSTLTREPYYKDEGKDEDRKLYAKDDQLWGYNAKDSAVTLEIARSLRGMLEKQGNMETFRRQSLVIEPCAYMSERGVYIDLAAARKRAEEIRLEEIQLKAEFSTYAPDVSPGSSKQLIDYFYTRCNIKPYRSRATGNPTVDANALKRLARRDDLPVGAKEAAQTVLKIRKIVKLASTYLEVPVDADSRLRCAYKTAVRTGRLSSTGNLWKTGTNMQNQPKVVRTYFKADPGYILVDPDLSQAENIVFANVAPEPVLLRAYAQGVDAHKVTYGLMFGIDPSKVSDAEGSSDIGDGSKSQRDWGKQFNYSLKYGLGFKAFALRVEIAEKEAKILVDKFLQIYPSVRNYQQNIQSMLAQNRTIVNCYGRKRFFMQPWGTELFQAAYAQIPQSTVADKINKDGLDFIYNNPICKDVELLAQVHDSVLFQIPIRLGPEKIAEIIRAIKASLEIPIPYHTPFVIPADAKVGFNWGKYNKKTNPLGCREIKEYSTLEETLELIIAEGAENGAQLS